MKLLSLQTGILPQAAYNYRLRYFPFTEVSYTRKKQTELPCEDYTETRPDYLATTKHQCPRQDTELEGKPLPKALGSRVAWYKHTCWSVLSLSVFKASFTCKHINPEVLGEEMTILIVLLSLITLLL